MLRAAGLATALAVALALGGCGDSDDGGDGGDATPPRREAAGAGRCLELWNEASRDVRARASLSHRGDTGEPDVLVGAYSGESFSATGETFDESGSPTSADVAVARGDCVAVDLTSRESETNWVMVLARSAGGRPAWHFLDETGDHPLAEPPQPLDRAQRARIVGFGVEAKLTTGGPR